MTKTQNKKQYRFLAVLFAIVMVFALAVGLGSMGKPMARADTVVYSVPDSVSIMAKDTEFVTYAYDCGEYFEGRDLDKAFEACGFDGGTSISNNDGSILSELIVNNEFPLAICPTLGDYGYDLLIIDYTINIYNADGTVTQLPEGTETSYSRAFYFSSKRVFFELNSDTFGGEIEIWSVQPCWVVNPNDSNGTYFPDWDINTYINHGECVSVSYKTVPDLINKIEKAAYALGSYNGIIDKMSGKDENAVSVRPSNIGEDEEIETYDKKFFEAYKAAFKGAVLPPSGGGDNDTPEDRIIAIEALHPIDTANFDIQYSLGEDWTAKNMSVKAYWLSGKTTFLTSDEVGFDITRYNADIPDTYAVIVFEKVTGNTLTYVETAVVNDKLNRISANGAIVCLDEVYLSEVVYYVGEDFRYKNLEVTAFWEYKGAEKLTSDFYTVDSSAFDNSKVGEYEIVVTEKIVNRFDSKTYEKLDNEKASYTVKVIEPTDGDDPIPSGNPDDNGDTVGVHSHDWQFIPFNFPCKNCGMTIWAYLWQQITSWFAQWTTYLYIAIGVVAVVFIVVIINKIRG